LDARERVRAILSDADLSRRYRFLSRFLFELSILARGFYVEAGTPVQESSKGLRHTNEIMHLASAAIAKDDAAGIVDAFDDHARMGGFELTGLFERTLAGMDR
jgi:hypothetical protein